MDARIQSIALGSPASHSGLQPGERVLSVNGQSDLEDMFDYQFAVLDESVVLFQVEGPDGIQRTVEVATPDGEDPGIVFDSPIFTPIKTCNNACPFCFIDQQPAGLRPSLYIKDDDYRLSYFCNTYITLTNLTRHDRERIERIRPGPLYVSVHSTLPEIRAILLKNPKAPPIMDELRWLASLDVPFHAQLVICPGINDGESLSQTLQDLATLHPHCLSVAVVPVGLTEHRDGLSELQAVTAAQAQDVIDRVDAFTEASQLPEFAFASDEFYVRAQRNLPNYEAYGDFPQLDDGVGTARLLTQEFFELEGTLPQAVVPPRKHIFLTGKLGAMVLQPIVQRLNAIPGLFIDLVTVQNNFWGQAVTVAGLITGTDILATLSHQDLSGYTSIFIPQTMLKSGDTILLDGISVHELAEKLGCTIQVVENPSHAQSLLDSLFTQPANITIG